MTSEHERANGQAPRRRFTAEELERLTRRHIEAENAHDLEALMATISEREVFFHVVPTGEKLRSHAEVREYYSRFLAVTDLHFEAHNIITDPARSQAAVEYTLTGTFPLPYLGLTRPRKATLDAVTMYAFDDDGKLTKEVGYYDQASLLASMGLVADPQKPLGQLLLLGSQSPLHALSGVADAVWKRITGAGRRPFGG